MSVRRLATEDIQPAAFAFSDANAAWARQIINKYPAGRQASAVIPLLMRAQEQEGWVSRPAIEYVADMLDMAYIRVLEVATFYTQFQLGPVGGKAHLQVCGTTPCMLRGAQDLIDVCKRRIHEDPLQLNEAGTMSWEEVECQGACVNAPMMMVFKDTYEDLTPERLEEIIDDLEAGKHVEPGPQNGRTSSAPISGPTTLTDEAVLRAGTPASPANGTGEVTDGEVAPSRAAKPKTDAPETDARLASPSSKKANADKEQAASVEAPAEDETAADEADPQVEGSARKRAHSGQRAKSSHAHQAPQSKRESGSAPVGRKMPESPSPQTTPVQAERPDQSDDLKLITGIGPKLEQELNGQGIWTYKQIAAWRDTDRQWVDEHPEFKGRIERDDWIRQAEALAKGGEAEYIRVFGKKPR